MLLVGFDGEDNHHIKAIIAKLGVVGHRPTSLLSLIRQCHFQRELYDRQSAATVGATTHAIGAHREEDSQNQD